MDTEPLGLLTSTRKNVPYIPYYMTDGNTVIKKWKEYFVDRQGNEAVLTKIEYKTKSGKLNEAVIQVDWLPKEW